MQSRKALAVVLDEEPPRDDDERPAEEPPDEVPGGGRVCLACGAESGQPECCERPELARLESVSRATREALGRLRRATAEHRAALRALRTQVLGEVARGRGEVDPPPPPAPPCLRCAVREAEAAATRAPRRKARRPDGQRALPFPGDPET